MATAKDILLRPISAQDANALVRRVHYSGKVAMNSQVHIGVFLSGRLEGALQFGPSIDKRKLGRLVTGTGWNEFIELNRMAFSEALPRNSESRALSVSMRLLRKHAPQLKWVVSFADATQCGDGTIYRAAGFVLTGITPNRGIMKLSDGRIVHRHSLEQITFGNSADAKPERDAPDFMKHTKGSYSIRTYLKSKGIEYEFLPGYQLRYLYFLDPACRDRLTVPVLPYSEIERRGAGMYRGTKRAPSADSGTAGDQPAGGGATPTGALLAGQHA
jgi:hypothetical protein